MAESANRSWTECLIRIDPLPSLCFSDCIDSHCLVGHQADERSFTILMTFRFIPGTPDAASGGPIRKSSMFLHTAFQALGDIDLEKTQFF
jgi:hypothetical protein